MIIRTDKRQTRYSIVDNTGFEDARLSLKAKGLLAYFLTKPDNWEVRIEDLVKRSPDGRDAIQSGLRELSKFGYAELRTVRGSSGRIGGKQWFIHEAPLQSVASPTDGKPGSRNNELEYSGLEFPDPSPINGFSVGRENRRTGKPSDGKPGHIVSTEVITNTDVLGNTEGEQTRARAGQNAVGNSAEKPVGQKVPPSSARPPHGPVLFSESPWACVPLDEWAEAFRAECAGIPADPAWYFNRAKDWSNEKGGTSRDWVATAARFAKDDLQKQKLVTTEQLKHVLNQSTRPVQQSQSSRTGSGAGSNPIVDLEEAAARASRITERRRLSGL